MSRTVGDFLVARLKEWGVHRIFGYPGDGISGVFGALDRAGGDPQFIQARHEEMAAFMACAHAKFTGQVGVCVATSGPGAIHLLNGLYDAKMDHQPVLAILGQAKRTSIGSFYQQEVDLLSLFKDLASDYIVQLSMPEQARHALDTAMRVAMSRRTVTAIILPNDLQLEPAVESPPREHGSVYSSVGYSAPRVVPEEADLKRAAEVLNGCEKVAMLVGAGALGATDEVTEVAEMLGAGVAKALLGKAAVPDDLPFVTGSIGLLGTKASWDMMQGCDGLLMVGTTFPYSEFLPPEGQARGVQIDLEPRSLGLRYPTEVNLHGEAALTLRALMPYLNRKSDRAWREKIEGWVSDHWKQAEASAMVEADPINPQRVFHELSPRLPENVILTADSGSGTIWFARHLKVRRGMMASLSGNLATMGPALPYAVAAKFAYPSRPVVAAVGDGAMQMNGINVLVTIQKYWKEWSNKQLVMLVLNNRDLNMVTWEQRVLAGDPKYDAAQVLPDFRYADYARSLGLGGLRVEKPADIAGAIEQAMVADRPFVLECLTDPEVPPLPPHITFEQAVKFWKSATKGKPETWHMLKQSVKEITAKVIPYGSSSS